MRFNSKFKIFIGSFLLVVCLAAHSAPMLNGIGVHQELGKEQFIGALFSESLSNEANTLLVNQQAMRIEIKVVATDGLSTRRFSRMWIEGMAINNKADALTEQADNMVKFDSMFRGRFLAGDHIVFAKAPGKGVSISVNGVSLGNIADNKFFSMLLTTWIGKVPLSSDYRDSLLKVGDVDASLRSRFDSIKPSAARIAEVSTWTSPAVAVIDSKTQKSAPKEDAKSSAKSDELLAAGPASIEKPKLELPKLTNTEASSTASVSVAEKPTVPTVAKAVTKDVEEEEEGPALTAQSLLARQFYVSDMLKRVFSKTRYPGKALERGQEGSIRIAVVVDRKGNIRSMKTLAESRYVLLNREANDAIRRAAPFNEIPAALSGDSFEFTVPIRFVLPKK